MNKKIILQYIIAFFVGFFLAVGIIFVFKEYFAALLLWLILR